MVDEALDALDGALGLSTLGAARLLAVVSDGIFSPTAGLGRAVPD